MARMSNATWKPLPRGFGTAIARHDLVVIHTCVGSLAGTDSYFRSGQTSSNSHFGTGGYGEIWQWGDTSRRSAANGAGNHRSITIENADMGPGFPAWNTRDGSAVPAFTPQQIEANAQICAWVHKTHGVPLVAADTSRPSARGIGYHRLGCDHWRVPDGELWSSSVGKVCPGPRRIAQIPQIIARAIEIVNGDNDMTPEQAQMLEHVYHTLTPGIEGVKFDGAAYTRLLSVEVDARRAADAVTPGVEGVKHDGATYALAKAAAGQRVDVDVNALSAGIGAALRNELSVIVREAVAAEMGADNQDQADAIVARIASRLAGSSTPAS